MRVTMKTTTKTSECLLEDSRGNVLRAASKDTDQGTAKKIRETTEEEIINEAVTINVDCRDAGGHAVFHVRNICVSA